MSSLQTLEDMAFGGADDSDSLLVDPNMIPTAATEVVMSGDGIAQFEEFSENPVNHEEEDPYQYEYAYDEDPDHHLHDIGEEEVVVAEEEFPDDWKEPHNKKLNLYEVLDGKMYLPHEKSAKRTRHEAFYQPADGPGGQEYNYSADDGVQEYREYAVYSSSNNTSKSNNNNNVADRNCPGCGMTLRRSVYYHHARMIREKGACNLFTPQRFPCTQCDARIGTLEKLCQHMEQIHHAPTQIKTAVFTNEEDFKTFRIDLEGKGGNFRMARGNKKNKKGVVQYFRCNRLQTLAKAQTFRPVDNPSIEELPSNRKRGRLHAQETRTNSAKQVIRTENSCTAFYNKAYLENGTIEVRYCEHHLHDDEKLRLPDAVRKRVIELARKNLPHVVILMIVKDERFTYCDRNSANDRRIQEMKTQDIRQVLAGNNRAEKTRVQRGEPPREIIMEKPLLSEILLGSEDDPNRSWTETRHALKIDRHQLTEQECRYLDLFDHNREEIMAKLNEKTRAETDKKILYDSFIHRLSSSQEVFKHIDYEALNHNESTMMKLRKACLYLTKIEELLLNPRRETQQHNRFSSYIRMMEEEFRREHERPDGNGGAGLEEIDVVGIDDDDYVPNPSDLHHHHHLHNVVGEEEVVGDGDGAYHQSSEELEELQEEEYIGEEVIEEVEIQMEETEEVDMEQVHQGEEDEEEEEQEHEEHEQEMAADGEDDESAEPTVTRAGRIVKKKPLFDS